MRQTTFEHVIILWEKVFLSKPQNLTIQILPIYSQNARVSRVFHFQTTLQLLSKYSNFQNTLNKIYF